MQKRQLAEQGKKLGFAAYLILTLSKKLMHDLKCKVRVHAC